MLQSVLVYTSLAFVMMLCGALASHRESMALAKVNSEDEKLTFFCPETLFPIIVFAIIFGCRFNVGVDYPSYYHAYVNNEDSGWEFLFQGIGNLMSAAGIHYAFYFSLWAFIQSFLLFYTFKNYRYLFFYISFFLIFGSYYLSMMNIIRQQLAACIFLYSLHYIDEKKMLKYYLCVLLAFLFHRSAILLVVVYPLFCIKIDWFSNKKVQLFLFLVAMYLHSNYDLVIQLISFPFDLFTKALGYGKYVSGILTNESLNSISQFGNNTGLGGIVMVFLSLPIILYSDQLKEYYDSNFFKIIYTLWFVRIMADMIVGESIILNRPFVYVANIKIVMLAFFVHYCFKTNKAFFQVIAIAFMVLHLLLFFNILYNGEVNTTMFTFFWQN